MSNTAKGVRVGAEQSRFGERYKMKGVTLNLLDLKVAAADTNGALAIFEQQGFTPLGGPPLHVHLYQDEIFYVLEGCYLFQVGDAQYQLKKGDTIFLPRQVPHAFLQLTEQARVLVMYQPAGKMEAFFKATDAWTVPPSADEIVAVFAASDMQVVGPPLQLSSNSLSDSLPHSEV